MKMYKLIIFFLLCLFCVGISFATSNNENSSINDDVGQNHNLNKITTTKDVKFNSKELNIKNNNPKNTKEFVVHDSHELENTFSWINKNGTSKEYVINFSDNYTNDFYYSNHLELTSNKTKSLIINGNNKIFYKLLVRNGYSIELNNLVLQDNEDYIFSKWTGPIVNFGNLTVNNCSFINNSAFDFIDSLDDFPSEVQGVGGAIYNEGNLSVNNSLFKGNFVGINGSAIASMGNSNSITLTNNVFYENYFGFYKIFPNLGTVFVEDAKKVTLLNNSFTNNIGDVSALYIGNSRNVYIKNNFFINNTGRDSLLTFNSSNITLENIHIKNNKARSNIINCENSIVNLSNIQATNNVGTYFIYNNNSKVKLSCSTINNNIELFNPNKDSRIESNNIELNKKLDISLTVDRDLTKQNKISININLSDISGVVNKGYIVMKLNYKEVLRNNITGKTIHYEFNQKDLGNINNLTIYYISNQNFVSNNISTTFLKKILNTKTSVNHTYVRPKSYVLLNASVMDENNKPANDGVVVFKLNGVTLKDNNNQVYYVKVKNSFAQLRYYVGVMSSKNYTFTAVYKGSINYYTSRADNVLTVYKNKTFMSVIVNPSSVINGRNINLTAYLTRGDNKPVNGGKVAFKLNGITIKDRRGNPVYINVINGKAILGTTISTGTSAKSYHISAVYSGTTENEEVRTGNYTFNVLKDNINLNLLQNTFVAKKGQKIKIQGQILNSENQKTKRDHKLAIKINNKTVLHTLAVNGAINITLSIDNLTHYENNITIVVGENNAYYERRINCKLYLK